MIEQSIQILDKATDQVVKVNDLNVNAGIGVTSASILQIIVIIFIIFAIYMIISIKKSFVSDIKKKLDIDDLQNKLKGLDSTINRNNEAMIEITASIERLGENIQKLSEVAISGKQSSKEEMYQLMTNRLQLSITQITDDFIDLVEQNSLFPNKSIILSEIRNKINYRVYQGRDFVYTVNFDKRIIDIVFSSTDTTVDESTECITSFFIDFYSVGRENITDDDYKLLKRKIRGFGKQMKLQSDKMLRKTVLGAKN